MRVELYTFTETLTMARMQDADLLSRHSLCPLYDLCLLLACVTVITNRIIQWDLY